MELADKQSTAHLLATGYFQNGEKMLPKVKGKKKKHQITTQEGALQSEETEKLSAQ
ncbi:MAG: hypothetical protein ACOYLR_04320 [Chlorobium sp.]